MSVITAYFLLRYSSLLRINQRHHSLIFFLQIWSISPREFSIVPRYPWGTYPSGVLTPLTMRLIGRLVIYYPHAIDFYTPLPSWPVKARPVSSGVVPYPPPPYK